MMRRTLLGSAIAIVISTMTFAAIDRPASAQCAPPQSAVPVHATLNQLMRGTQFPLANVVFAAQGDDPATIKPSDRPSAATDPLTSVFGRWMAVENSALSLAESSTLLLLPGRLCENGRPVPVQNEDWIGFVRGMRDASMAAWQAAQSKNQDRMLDISEKLAASCSSCHQVYRRGSIETGTLANRCVK